MGLLCHNISFSYPGTGIPVFENLNLEITEPGFNALFGPSGVGKTSFARIITGSMKGWSGTVQSDGIERMAYTSNLERLPGWATVGTHLEKIIPAERKTEMAELIPVFGIEECLDQRFAQLSLGQKNRVNLLRYLLQGFRLLVMDESLANVDEMTREKIILKIKDMFPEVFFLYISHNVVEVSRFCREIFVFRDIRRKPQMLRIEGRNMKNGQEPDKAAFEQTLLEIMNAS